MIACRCAGRPVPLRPSKNRPIKQSGLSRIVGRVSRGQPEASRKLPPRTCAALPDWRRVAVRIETAPAAADNRCAATHLVMTVFRLVRSYLAAFRIVPFGTLRFLWRTSPSLPSQAALRLNSGVTGVAGPLRAPAFLQGVPEAPLVLPVQLRDHPLELTQVDWVVAPHGRR
jgi:hypothetical protein